MVEIGALLKHTLFRHCGDLYEIEHSSELTRTTLARNKRSNALEAFSNSVPVEVVKAKEATKHDASKPRYDLLPPEALEEIVKVLGFGAAKYEPRGWEKGLPYSRYFGAAMRHLWAWWGGENLDPESGLSHLAHAIACCMFLLTHQLRGMHNLDDRQKKENSNGC